MGELVAEIDDPPRVRNRLKEGRRHVRQRCNRFTYDDELALDRRPDQPRLGIAGQVEAGNSGLDRAARINNIGW